MSVTYTTSFNVGESSRGEFGTGTIPQIHGKKATVEYGYGLKFQIKLYQKQHDELTNYKSFFVDDRSQFENNRQVHFPRLTTKGLFNKKEEVLNKTIHNEWYGGTLTYHTHGEFHPTIGLLEDALQPPEVFSTTESVAFPLPQFCNYLNCQQQFPLNDACSMCEWAGSNAIL